MIGDVELPSGLDVVAVEVWAAVVVVGFTDVVGIVDGGRVVVVGDVPPPNKAYEVKLEMVVETVLKDVLTSEVSFTQADPFH
jgi:hypothetical protein